MDAAGLAKEGARALELGDALGEVLGAEPRVALDPRQRIGRARDAAAAARRDGPALEEPGEDVRVHVGPGLDLRQVGGDRHREDRRRARDEALGHEESEGEILEGRRRAHEVRERAAAQDEFDEALLDHKVARRPGRPRAGLARAEDGDLAHGVGGAWQIAHRAISGHGSTWTAQTLNSGILATGSSAAIVRRLAGASR